MPSHFLFELLAYFLGFRYFLSLKSKGANPLQDHPDGLWVAVGAILGAALGSKVLYWLQYPTYILTHFPDPVVLMGGKTIVGGFLGGLIGVEFTKKRLGISASTGDLFVFPLILGTMIGRVGCFLAGLEDYTYGNPTTLPWGVDFGDGIPRHPTQLYEIAFLAVLWMGLLLLRPRLRQSGDLFKLFMVAYVTFRFFIEFIKPPHGGFPPAAGFRQPQATLYGGILTAIQLACLAGLAYYWRHIRRIGKELRCPQS